MLLGYLALSIILALLAGLVVAILIGPLAALLAYAIGGAVSIILFAAYVAYVQESPAEDFKEKSPAAQ